MRIAHLGTGESLMPDRCWQLIKTQSGVAISGWSIGVESAVRDAKLDDMLLRRQYPPVSAAVVQLHFVAAKLTTESTQTKSYNLLFLLDYESVTTALDGYTSKGWSQRISARESVSEDGCRGGVKLARYALFGKKAPVTRGQKQKNRFQRTGFLFNGGERGITQQRLMALFRPPGCAQRSALRLCVASFHQRRSDRTQSSNQGSPVRI